MFLIYQLLITLIILFSPIIILIRVLKGKEDILRFKEKFCFFSKRRHSGKLLWFHGSSVGELMSVLPVLNKYDKENSFDQILVTSSTMSSSKILQKYNFKKVVHQFFPIDHIFFSNFFLNYWRPNSAIFLESEIWPSIYRSLKKRNIPLILLNARITKKTFKRWMKLKRFSLKVFDQISFAYPQNKETIIYLKKLGVEKIEYIGNLKFFEDKKIVNKKFDNKIKNKFKKYKICIAASTHADEELFAAKTHLLLKKKNKNLITIIIPRHVHRVGEINNELKKLNLKVTYHSAKVKNLKDIDIYVVDTFGESRRFYKIATTVFLGGSLINKGGQNPIEPARYGAKILHGPNVDNFKEVYAFLKSLKVSKEIRSPKQFANEVIFRKKMEKVKKIQKLGNVIFKMTLNKLNKKINYET
tara:strand:- start:1866 stop:3107 length:1242 start_codon:yes stop_codon:yes gene_type:complete